MATLCLVNMRCIFSVNEWTYGTVTTPLDFSCSPTMNRDEGAYQLSPIWTQVISTPKPGRKGASTE